MPLLTRIFNYLIYFIFVIILGIHGMFSSVLGFIGRNISPDDETTTSVTQVTEPEKTTAVPVTTEKPPVSTTVPDGTTVPEKTTEPVTESATEPVTQPYSETIEPEPSTLPASDTTTEPSTEPDTEPTTEPRKNTYTLNWVCTLPGEEEYTVVSTEQKRVGEIINECTDYETIPGYGFAWEKYAGTMPGSDLTIEGTYTEGKYTIIWLVNDVEIGRNLLSENERTSSYIPTPSDVPVGKKLVVKSEMPEKMPTALVKVVCDYEFIDYKVTWKWKTPSGASYSEVETGYHYGDTLYGHQNTVCNGYSFKWIYPDSVVSNRMPAEDIIATGKYTKVGRLSVVSFGGSSDDVVSDSDSLNGNYYFCGYSSSYNGDFASLQKSGSPYGFVGIAADGGISKIVSYTETSASVYLTGIAGLREGGCAVCGYKMLSGTQGFSDSIPFYNIYDDNLNLISHEEFKGTDDDKFTCIASVKGGFVIGGNIRSKEGIHADAPDYKSNCMVIRFKTDGTEVWRRYYGGSSTTTVESIATDNANSVFADIRTACKDGSFSTTKSLTGNSFDNIIIKLGVSGDEKWRYVIAGDGNDNFNSVVADGVGGCAVAGYYAMNGTSPTGTLSGITNYGGNDSVIMKITSAGRRSWYRVIGGTENDCALDITKCGDNYVVTGYTGSDNTEFESNSGEYDAFASVTNSSGKKVSSYTIGGSSVDKCFCVSCIDSEMYVFGISSSKNGDFEGINTYVPVNANSSDAFIAVYALNQ